MAEASNGCTLHQNKALCLNVTFLNCITNSKISREQRKAYKSLANDMYDTQKFVNNTSKTPE